MQIDGLDIISLSSTQQADLKSAFAADIAVACGLADAASVWDVQGNHGIVSFADNNIEAWVEVPQNSYANVLARNLYAQSFKEQLVTTATDQLGAALAPVVGDVVLNLETFHAQIPTVTVTSTTATQTVTATVTTTTEQTTETSTMHANDFLGATTTANWFKSESQRGKKVASLVQFLFIFLVTIACS